MVSVASDLNLIEHSLRLGDSYLRSRSKETRKQLGQFLTPAPVARFMAARLAPIPDGARVLDPAVGSGVLTCALIEQAARQRGLSELWVDGYEIDPALLNVAREALQLAIEDAAQWGLKVHIHLTEADFVRAATPLGQDSDLYAGSLLDVGDTARYDLIIANPPYFKLKSTDPRLKLIGRHHGSHPNIYTAFMFRCSQLLNPQGRACFIVPRSFCSGAYFAAFRRAFFKRVVIESIHLFESRDDTFQQADVLQENVIVTFRARQPDEHPVDVPESINISASLSGDDLTPSVLTRQANKRHFLGPHRDTFFFRLPLNELDEQLLDVMDAWDGNLRRYGIRVSTGPVVPFRARDLLYGGTLSLRGNGTAPLLWMNNVIPQRVKWPLENGKPQFISLRAGDRNLLVPLGNYVLVRRFSAKEEQRRLIAAPLLASDFAQHGEWIGLENHLNYIYQPDAGLEDVEVIGLSALLNSAMIDRYIRLMNGNTQVNATELRSLPLPSMETIRLIGVSTMLHGEQADLDQIVFSFLRANAYLPDDFPFFRETRITMGKIQDAQAILQALGLPAAQQNEISALTLLVLARLSEDDPWSVAQRESLRIHDILTEIAARYGREYAENTRETIRRQVIHQFEQAGIVWRNPDEPDLPTNSPRTHYALTDLALQTIRQFGTARWSEAVQMFLQERSPLLEVYRQQREQHLIPLRLSSGEEYHLTPGKHNQLQAAIIEQFGPRFAPGAEVLYLGDAANKTLILDEGTLRSLSVSIASHDKLPDIVLYDRERHWLFLIEAVTSHGPVSPKRVVELESVFQQSTASRVYVTVFPDFATFKSFIADIAWETEVWIAEIPDHMIHYNGDSFLGPRG